MQYDYFPVTLDALRADVRYHDLVEGTFQIADVHVRTRYLNHPALTLGFRLQVDGATVAYICDHEPHARYLATHAGDLAGEDLAHADFLRGADLVIHDAQYTRGEYPEKAGWGHSTADYAVRICLEAGVRRLALTHHDPLHDDDAIDRMMEELRANLDENGAALEVFAAREGQVLELIGLPVRPGAQETEGPSAVWAGATGLRRVLVALDPSPEADTVMSALVADEVAVVTCADVSEVLERFHDEQPGLVVLDGGAEGLAACRAIRELGGDTEDVAIMLVASAAGTAPEASEWLTSPFSAEYARSRIRAWLLRVESRWVRAPRPESEERRIAALRRLALLDTAPDERFDRLARLAAGLLQAPMSLVTLVDHDRQWFKSRVGTLLEETSRDASFCAHAILGDGAMVVPDALEDERFADNPLVSGPPHVRFYAGCPLVLPDGHAMGTLCVMDTRPRELSSEQRALLRDLADLVEEELVHR
jgi:CheY-like chemotaxis protein